MIIDVPEVGVTEVESTEPARQPALRNRRTSRAKDIGKQRGRRTTALRTRTASSTSRTPNPLSPSPTSEGKLELPSNSSQRGIWNVLLRYFRNMRAPQKRMRVCESVSLGDKRFLAIVRVDCESFLLGGSTGSVSMLAKLNDQGSFSAVLQNKSVDAGLLR
ncbi:MAG: flagellar biosynthetic protein FliO [Acidobacteria bacterium]|nr:flagellar biosynthetic protein FliO [Acidobacteriota bacterium]